MYWSDDKELLLGVIAINWNLLKNKKHYFKFPKVICDILGDISM